MVCRYQLPVLVLKCHSFVRLGFSIDALFVISHHGFYPTRAGFGCTKIAADSSGSNRRTTVGALHRSRLYDPFQNLNNHVWFVSLHSKWQAVVHRCRILKAHASNHHRPPSSYHSEPPATSTSVVGCHKAATVIFWSRLSLSMAEG